MDQPSLPQDSGRRLVIGIGNPGDEYDGTRHNVGFAVLDLVARQRGLEFGRLERTVEAGLSGRVKARIASAPDGSWHLVKPLTYVNGSGIAVGALARAWAIPPHSIFVVADDLDLPLGRIRIRPSGSSGGHRGLLSIEQALATRDYPRLRLGIGRPAADHGLDRDRGASVDHVLSRFAPEERQSLEESLALAAQAVGDWLGMPTNSPTDRPGTNAAPDPGRSPMDQLMNRYNTPRPAGPQT